MLALILMDWTRIGRQAGFLLAFIVAAWLLRRLMTRIPERDRWYAGLIWLTVPIVTPMLKRMRSCCRAARDPTPLTLVCVAGGRVVFTPPCTRLLSTT